MRNDDKTAPGDDIRNNGMIPATSQIPNNSVVSGQTLNDALAGIQTAVGAREMVKVENVVMRTLNNEQSKAIGGSALRQFVPFLAVVHIKDAGAGAAANGDMAITIGTAAGGTQIKGATVCTGLTGKNGRFVINLTGFTASILGNASIFVKVTTADTTAGVGHLADVYLYGESFVSTP